MRTAVDEPGVGGAPWAAVWRLPGRSTRALVDLDQIHRNYRALSAAAEGTPFMAVVKANAYGHGAIMVARTAVDAGAAMLGVATVDEARVLRDASVSAPILVMGPIDDSELQEAVRLEIDISVGDLRFLDLLLAARRIAPRPAPIHVHVKVDTGMHRFGASVADAVDLAAAVESADGLRLRGLFTHFATADDADPRLTDEQAGLFRSLLERLRQLDLRPEIVHAANSAASIRRQDLRFDMTRIGILAYGLRSSANVQSPDGVRSALGLRSLVRRVMELRPGDAVSYGSTYRATSIEHAALVPIGYADGFPRSVSNRGWMSVGGVRAPVRGRVCMDQTVIGVDGAGRVVVNNEVVIIGDGVGEPTADDIAGMTGTINYEIVAGLSPRIPRFHWRGGRVVATEDLSGLHLGMKPE